MTPQPSTGVQHQQLDGRTVRDIVEYSPSEVDEPWCRRIFRQVLQSLELQYAMGMPHRPITPDTIVFHDNGEPLLAPTPGADPDGDEADDLNALARVVHYAITQELAPQGPLAGRTPGYSAALAAAVDRCMADDPAERPRTIAALRDLLGIVPLGLPLGVGAAAATAAAPASSADAVSGMLSTVRPGVAPAAAPGISPAVSFDVPPGASPDVSPDVSALTPPPVSPPVSPTMPYAAAPAASAASAAVLSHPSSGTAAAAAAPGTATRAVSARGLSRWQRWALAGGGAAILAALALVMFAEMRDAGSFDHVVLTLPQTPAGTAAAPASGTAPAPATVAGAAMPGVPGAPVAPQAPATGATQAAIPAAPVVDGNAYKLQIQPWGVVYVDDVDRGVSPPVKRLVLAPGKHTVRIANPNFHDRVLEVDSAPGGGSIAVDFNDAPQ